MKNNEKPMKTNTNPRKISGKLRKPKEIDGTISEKPKKTNATQRKPKETQWKNSQNK